MSQPTAAPRAPRRARSSSRRARPVPCSFCGARSTPAEACPTCTARPELVAPAPTGPAQVVLGFRADGRFGLRGRTSPGGPLRLLTYGAEGHTNNTRLRIGQAQPLLGELDPLLPMARRGGVVSGVWSTRGLRVAQRLALVTGPTTQTPDTVRVDYLLRNCGPRRLPSVGLRVMIDTLIGRDDGVPFVLPGHQGILDVSAELEGDRVPPFVQAIEFADPVAPGTVVHLTLRGADATPPERLVIDRWPGSSAAYEFFRGPRQSWGRDSALACYWAPRAFAPGEARRITFFYGLGGLSSTHTGNRRVSITAPRRVAPGATFPLSARIFEPGASCEARVDLPAGFRLAPGCARAQRVEDAADAPFAFVFWDVVAPAAPADGTGPAALRVVLDDGVEESQDVAVVS